MSRDLVCWVGRRGMVVLSRRTDYEQLLALSAARTWRQFQAADPVAYSQHVESGVDNEEDVPDLSDAFDISMVAGFDEGDYPPWQQAMMEYFVPGDLLERHGVHESTVHNGSYWAIPVSAKEELVSELSVGGFKVELVESPGFD